MSGATQSRHEPADRALAYPEPEPHPNWSTRRRYSPLTPAEQLLNQKMLLRGLTGQAA